MARISNRNDRPGPDVSLMTGSRTSRSPRHQTPTMAPSRTSTRTQIQPRRVTDTSGIAGQGSGVLAQGLESFNRFFKTTTDISVKKLNEETTKENARVNEDLKRLIMLHPQAAQRLRETGDYAEFFEATGNRVDPSILQRTSLQDALMHTTGSTLAANDQNTLEEQLRNSDRNVPLGSTVSSFIAKQTKGMTEQVKNSYVDRVLRHAERITPGISASRRKAAVKAIRDETRKNSSEHLQSLPTVTPEGIEQNIELRRTAYEHSMGTVEATVAAIEDFRNDTLAGLETGDPRYSAAASQPYFGHAPMSQDPKYADRVADAKANAVAQIGRIHSRAEAEDAAMVNALTKVAEFDPSLENFRAAMNARNAHVASYRRGRTNIMSPQINAIDKRLVKLHRQVAKNNINIESALNGEIIDKKTAEYLMSSAGLQSIMREKNMSEAQAMLYRNGIIAEQSPDGVGAAKRDQNTAAIVQSQHPQQRAKAILDVILLREIRPNVNPVGKYYNKEAHHVVDFVQRRLEEGAANSNPENVLIALEQYEEHLAANNGVLPSPHYPARVGITPATMTSAEKSVMDAISDELGGIENVAGLRGIVKDAIIESLWANSGNIHGDSVPDAVLKEAKQEALRSRERTVIVRPGRLYGTNRELHQGPRQSDLPMLTDKQLDHFQEGSTQAIPEFLWEDGVGLTTDKYSDRTNSRSVILAVPGSASGVPLAFAPNEKITLPAGSEKSTVFATFSKSGQRPATGFVDLMAPSAPAKGEPHAKIIDDNYFLLWADGAWRVRYRTDKDREVAKTLDDTQLRRNHRFAEEQERIKRDLLSAAAAEGGITGNAASEAKGKTIVEALDNSIKQSIKDGHLLDNQASGFIGSVADNIQRHYVKASVPVSRTTNQRATTGKDRVVGYGLSLDRQDADKWISGVGADPKAVRAGLQELTPLQMRQVQVLSIRSSIATLRKRLGAADFADMSPGQISAIIELMETGRWEGRNSSILSADLIRALKSDRWGDVAKVLKRSVNRSGSTGFDPDDLTTYTDRDLQAVFNRRGVPAEIQRRKSAGIWAPNKSQPTPTTITDDVSVSTARERAISLFEGSE